MSRFRLTGLRSRILLLMIVAMLPALVLVLYTAERERQERAERVQQEALQLASLATARHEELIDVAREIEEMLSLLPFVVEGEEPACSELLASLLEKNLHYSGIFVLDPLGDLICSAPAADGEMNLADRAYFQQALEWRRFFVGPYIVGRLTDRRTLPAVYPVVSAEGEVEAVLVVGLDLDWLGRLNAAWGSEEQTIVVFDEEGTLLSFYPSGGVEIGDHSAAPIIRHVLDNPDAGIAEAEGVDGEEKLYGYAPLVQPGDNTVFVAVGIPATIAYGPATRELISDISALLLLLASLALAWLFGEMLIMRRVDRLVATTQALANGDLDARTNVSEVWGELDHLAQTVDDMADSLQQKIKERQRTEAHLHRLARRLATAQEEERRLLARELHDSAGQLVTALVIKLQMLQSELPESATALREELEASADLAANIGDELRDLSHSLRPPALDQLGLDAALRNLCEEFTRHTELPISYEGAELPEVPETVAISCFRFVQEGLNNIAKHAKASEASVTLSYETESLILTLADDGIGFSADAAPGMGLLSMRERIEGVGGELEIDSSGEGTCITARLTLAADFVA